MNMLAVKYDYPTVKLFDEIFGDLFNSSVINSSGIKTPIHDIIETDKEYIIETSLAGILRENISVEVEKDVLTINAERNEIINLQYKRKETYFGKYELSFKLPNNINQDKIDVILYNGILRIVIPKMKEEPKLDKLTIKIK